MACVYIFQCKNKNIIVRYKTIPKEKKKEKSKVNKFHVCLSERWPAPELYF